jgi:hypothetical protein
MSTEEKTSLHFRGEHYSDATGGAPGIVVEIPHGHPAEPLAPAHGDSIHLPKPTPWPIVVALGFTLLVAGILTQFVISILGGLMLIYGCVGWFKDVLPHEQHEDYPVKVQELAVSSSRKRVARIHVNDEHRAHLPVHTFSVLSGVKGGIAGGIAMIIPALAYGLIAQHSIWYPINLLGGAGIAGWHNPSMADLRAFHPAALGIAAVIHIISCLLIGLLYGAILPLAPKRPVLLGGILAPLVWTGLLYAALPIINPEMSSHINWADFLVAQVTFGVVAGLVVARSSYTRTAQSMPFAMRLGLETPGLTSHGSAPGTGQHAEERR